MNGRDKGMGGENKGASKQTDRNLRRNKDIHIQQKALTSEHGSRRVEKLQRTIYVPDYHETAI